MGVHGHYRNAYSLVTSRLTGYIGVHHDPPASTDSQAIRWGKSGAKFQDDRIRQGVGSGKTDGEAIGGAHLGR